MLPRLPAIACALALSITLVSSSAPQTSTATVERELIGQYGASQVVPSAEPLPSQLAPKSENTTIDPKEYDKYKGPNLSQRVILTYDDCPNSLTQLTDVLVYASTQKIGLVLAPTGECFADFKKKYGVDISTLIRSYGQYAINHSYDHPDLTSLKKHGRLDEARVTSQLTTEVKADYGRPPYGARNTDVDKIYDRIGMRVWLWSVDTNDWKNGGKSRTKIVQYVGTHAHPGDTVLMHMQHQGFHPEALQQIAEKLHARGVELCRPFRGWDNPADGPVLTAPAQLGNAAIPC